MLFKILKDKHFSEPKWWFKMVWFNREIKGFINFDKSCIYEIEDNDKYDINKLVGLSDDLHHHKNSIRLGWNCLNNELYVYSYIYINKKRYDELICKVKPNKDYSFRMKITENDYLISFNSIEKSYKRESKWKWINLILKPYFGGNKTAPHDMRINIRFK